MEQSESELVMVAVPRRDLERVYEFIGQLHREAVVGVSSTASAAQSANAKDEETPVAEWTVAELNRFAATGSTTNVTIAKVLDVLAAEPGKFFSTSTLEERTGVPRANLKGSMSALTRHINRHYSGHEWMFTFEWGTHLGPDYPAEAHYTVDEAGAQRWREARHV